MLDPADVLTLIAARAVMVGLDAWYLRVSAVADEQTEPVVDPAIVKLHTAMH